ncbi:hypothetical protein B0H17DRAFT_928503 [Mycena rosella]|uniref:Uncharacterized protein n=1 Tax=Mycena rosella TaxID=1033263 RepID=A0AAD7DQC2_MYCRO|nr:hypothetical protein B0H17DRAFT_928503 [Mycena rosella]
MDPRPQSPPRPRLNRNYLTPLDANPTIPRPPADIDSYRPSSAPIFASLILLPPPQLQRLPQPFAHQQPRLRKAKLTAEQKRQKKFRAMEKLLKEYPFRNLGEFLAILFHNPVRGEPDPCGTKHSRVFARFL